jgi:hypothetical protein
MPYDAPLDSLDRKLVLEFFWKFSVFECALKREGYLRAGLNDGAQPDWSGFGRSIRGRFREIQSRGFQDALRTLIDASPQQQVVRRGQLAWRVVQRRGEESEEEFTLRLVRTTRNNLFHGGKYPDGPVEEVARDRKILRAALGVLEGCYELHPGVARWIREGDNERRSRLASPTAERAAVDRRE